MATSTGAIHSAAVGEDGSLFVWGSSVFGSDDGYEGNIADRLNPTRVAGLPSPVRQVAAGYCHMGIVTEAGDLLMSGVGARGQLGLGDEHTRSTPTLVARALFDGVAVLMVACGDSHTAALTQGGGVYTFGVGHYGSLGHGDEEDQLAPRRVPVAGFNGERIVMVSAGDGHSVALSEGGHLYTWGFGAQGQLGHNDREDQWAPRQVEGGRFGGEKVVFVAAGAHHTVAVTVVGRLYTWGNGGRGRLGHGDIDTRLVPTLVAAGAIAGSAAVMAASGVAHTLVVTHDGALWACGCGELGRLGLNDEKDRYSFERVGAEEFGGARVVAAAAGWNHSVAVTEDGALWTWGCGGSGKSGHGDREDRLVPTVVAAGGLGGERIGRCRRLPAEHALSFAMGTHTRLGAASPVRCLAGEVGLLRMILGWCRKWRWVSGAAGTEEGVVRLLGGWGTS